MEERYLRHSDLIDVERLHTIPITMVGAGSVGSATVMPLVKMGAKNITVYDDDIVSEVNIGNQFYKMDDIDEYKVDALANIVMDFEKVPLKTEVDKFKGTEKVEGIVIVAVDSMLHRKRIWDNIKKNDKVSLFIDPRMGGRVARIYIVNPKKGNSGTTEIILDYATYTLMIKHGVEYEKTLYSDDDASPERCTERTIIYNVFGIASLICKAIEDWMKE